MKKGFTLVELLVVVSLLLISVGIAGDLIISVVRSYNKTKILNEIEQNGSYVLSKITYDLRNAKTINRSDASITIVDVNDAIITYSVGARPRSDSGSGSTNGVTRKLGVSGAIEDMSNTDGVEGVSVVCTGGVCFEELSTDPETIKINLTISQAPYALGGASSATQNFSAVVVLNSLFQ